ncbi:MAG: BatD family protein [Flavitalea sp.]
MAQLNMNNFTVKISRLIFSALLLLCIAPSFAQSELKFVATVSEKNLALRQPFQVQFVVYGAKYVPQIKVPSIKGLLINDTFTNQSTQVIGGKTLQWIDSYSKVLILTPTRTGKFTIPAASVTINGKTLHTKPIQVTVSQTGLSSAPESDEDVIGQIVQDESELAPGETMEEKVKKNFFLKANTNKTVCYVGEPLEVVYKAYSRLNSNSQVVKRPSFPGFSVVEMMESYDNRPEIEMVNGNAYYTNLIRKVQLFPLQPGTYQLDPAEIESVVHFIKTDRPSTQGMSQLQRLLNDGQGRRSPVDHFTTLKTAPVSIEVKPLPEKDQPEDFGGAVGQYSLHTIMPKEQIRQGELVKISWELEGSGNLQLVTLPDVIWPKGIDTSEPSVKEDVNQYVYPLRGKKTFNYAVTARDTGDFTIPPVSFAYFDPGDQKYKTLETEPVSFHVNASAAKPFFASEPIIEKNGIPLHLYWFGGVVLIIVGWVVYQSLNLRKERKAGKLAAAAKAVPVEIPAPKPTTDELFANAKTSLTNSDTKGFFREVQQVLWSIAAEKCAVLPSFLNKQNISSELQKQEIPAATINNFLIVLNECEWALYTPDHNVSDMESLLTNARLVSSELMNA